MSNSVIAASNPARSVLNSIITKAGKKMSRANLVKSTNEYGAYCKALECDLDLIRRTITETPRSELVEALNELYNWFWKMDVIAAQAH